MSSSKRQITGAQIKAARGLLTLHQSDLAALVGLTRTTIALIETGRVKPRASSLDRIAAALEMRGIEFVNGRGVLLKKTVPEDPTAPDSAGK